MNFPSHTLPELLAAAIAPPACKVFTPAEMAERIAAHAERVAREEAMEPASQVLCFGCGAVGDTWTSRKRGWMTRHLYSTSNMQETYCPDCFSQWGWPDATEGAA